ncbi:MAG: DNA primase [Oceanospirillales bacterium LUC14_002_19_P2]|nr:MAG: DNA primase [Oceanospirillales bacterium LUC14_002_19_P2]
MAGLIPQHFIDDLLARTDIVDVINERVPLKKAGRNHQACCPFHKEKTPSFTVSQEKQFYYCFGCGASGNALGFIMDLEHLDFPVAVEQLASRLGLEVPREDGGKHQHTSPNPAYELLTKAADYYQEQLKSHSASEQAISYLRNRGLDGKTARQFNIGFAPPGWDNLLKTLGTTPEREKLLTDTGMLVEHEEKKSLYDRFRHRIMFPIRDQRGRVIGFGGRVLGDEKPKYLNSPESPVFHKGQELYGLYEARQANRELKQIIVVEGYMDVVALAQQGITNSVATLGTATTREHLEKLFKLTSQVVFCFDGDQAGRKAAWRALENTLPEMHDGRQVRFMFLPQGEDPDSMVRQEGKDAFLKRIHNEALTLDDYFFKQLANEVDTTTLDGCARLAKMAEPYFQQLPEGNYKHLLDKKAEKTIGLKLSSDASTHSQQYEPATEYTPTYQDDPRDAWQETPQTFSSNKLFNKDKPWQKKQEEISTPKISLRLQDRALRHLLNTPSLATEINIETLSKDDSVDMQQFVSLVESLQNNPQQTTYKLLGSWYGTQLGARMTELLNNDIPISNLTLQKEEFCLTIARLEADVMKRLDTQILSPLEHLRLAAEKARQKKSQNT